MLSHFLRNAVKCNTCQGTIITSISLVSVTIMLLYGLASWSRSSLMLSYFVGLCHELCTVSSTVDGNDDDEYTNACKKCCQNRALTGVKCSDESPTSPLLLQGQYFPKQISAKKGVNVGNSSRLSASVATLKHSSDRKHGNSSNSTTKKKHKLGVVWRKKNEDTGIEFRLRNIFLKGNLDGDFPRLTCYLCRKPYNPDLMYIRCETCTSKFVPGRNSFNLVILNICFITF